MSKQEDFYWPDKLLKKRGKVITKLEYQRKPKWTKNSIESEAYNSARGPTKLSKILVSTKFFNPNLIGLFMGSFWGGKQEEGKTNPLSKAR